MALVQFKYRNHRGEIALRTVVLDAIEYHEKPHEECKLEPGWFICGYDTDKQARRSFALNNIIMDDAVRNGIFRLPINGD